MGTGRKLLALVVLTLLSFLPAARLLADDPDVPGSHRCATGWIGKLTVEGEAIQRIKSQRHTFRAVWKWEFELKEGPLGPKGYLKDYVKSVSIDIEGEGSTQRRSTLIHEWDFNEQVSPGRGPSEIKICRMRNGDLIAVVTGPSVRLTTKVTSWTSPPIRGQPNPSVSYPDNLQSEGPIRQTIPIKAGITDTQPLFGKLVLADTVVGDANSDWFQSTKQPRAKDGQF